MALKRQNPEVKLWARSAGGSQTAFFTPEPGITVQVAPTNEEENDKALALALDLSDVAGALARQQATIDDLRRLLDAATAGNERLRAQLPPVRPASVLGPGWIRFDDKGRLWMLSKREPGWGSFGFLIGDWDDLFREWNVRISEHGTDKTGPWWKAEPIRDTDLPPVRVEPEAYS